MPLHWRLHSEHIDDRRLHSHVRLVDGTHHATLWSRPDHISPDQCLQANTGFRGAEFIVVNVLKGDNIDVCGIASEDGALLQHVALRHHGLLDDLPVHQGGVLIDHLYIDRGCEGYSEVAEVLR